MNGALQRLAKLRQFKGGDLANFMKTEFRQNMLAIESSIRNLSTPAYYVRTQLDAMSVANNTSEQFIFTKSTVQSDVSGCIDANSYLVKSTGWYEIAPNIKDVLVNGIKTIQFVVMVGEEVVTDPDIFTTTATTLNYVTFSLKFPLYFKAGDVVKFYLSNSSGSNTNVCSISQSYLEIKQLTQG